MFIFYYLILFGLPISLAILVLNYFCPIGRVLPILFSSAQLFGAVMICSEKNRKQEADTTDMLIMYIYFGIPIIVYLFIYIINKKAIKKK